MVPMKLYNIQTMKSPERVKEAIEEAVSILKQNCILADFNEDDIRETYSEHLRLVKNYLTILELMLDDE
tara:strand:- start:1037 stop:1243 length:207 start_codon:yes stop_codon:yes gene_type:complete